MIQLTTEQKENIEKIKKFLNTIKSDIIDFFGGLNLVILFAAILSGITLILLTLLINFALFLKLFFVIAASIITTMLIFEHVDEEDRKKAFYQCFLYIILSLCVMEYGLYSNSNYTDCVSVNVVVSDEEHVVKNRSGEIVNGETIPYKIVAYYDATDNDRMEVYVIEDGDESRLPSLINVTHYETYIDYVPFLIYKKKHRYIHSNESKG